MFDRVRVISLPRRGDRRELLDLSQLGLPWQFAVGESLPAPAGWAWGDGHYGCYRAHLRELSFAAAADESILLLEDDVELHPDFGQEMARFAASLASLPPWDGVWLGGQLIQPLPEVAPGVVRVDRVWRTHAYGLRGDFLHLVVHVLERAGPALLDYVLANLVHQGVVYAPTPWLAGQRPGSSDTAAPPTPLELWQLNC